MNWIYANVLAGSFNIWIAVTLDSPVNAFVALLNFVVAWWLYNKRSHDSM
jgi:hypothetical protein